MTTIRWWDASIKPARPGTYEVQVRSSGTRRTWARWTGEHWCCWALSPAKAALCDWRGQLAGYAWIEADPTALEPERCEERARTSNIVLGVRRYRMGKQEQ